MAASCAASRGTRAQSFAGWASRDATSRLKRAEADVEALRARCDDLDYLVARAVVAKSRGEAVSPFPGGAEDSLLARFRALEEE